MKKTILTAMTVLVTGMTAHAKMSCFVSAETQPGKYETVLAMVDYDGVSKNQTIFVENEITYAVGLDGNGSLGVYAYNEATKKVYAGAIAKTNEQLIVVAPDIKRGIGCVTVK